MEKDLLRRFGESLRRHRERRGWSQEELAHRAGIGRQHISDLENGKREAGLSVLQMLADSFGISLSKLFRGF